jgi:hypothetical protein
MQRRHDLDPVQDAPHELSEGAAASDERWQAMALAGVNNADVAVTARVSN